MILLTHGGSFSYSATSDCIWVLMFVITVLKFSGPTILVTTSFHTGGSWGCAASNDTDAFGLVLSTTYANKMSSAAKGATWRCSHHLILILGFPRLLHHSSNSFTSSLLPPSSSSSFSDQSMLGSWDELGGWKEYSTHPTSKSGMLGEMHIPARYEMQPTPSEMHQ